MPEFCMPMLGADMEAGTLIRWLVKPGDRVARGDVVAEVETDKATVEVEIFEGGVVAELVVGEGEKVPVGTLLARLDAADAPAAAPRQAPPSAPVAALKRVEPPAPAMVAAPAPPAEAAEPHRAARVTPGARARAAEIGIDPARIRGTGVQNAVTRADVERAGRERAKPRADGHVRASPAARRHAAEAGIALDSVAGTGPGGAVTLADVERAARASAPKVEPIGRPEPAAARPPTTAAPASAPAGPATPDAGRIAARRRAIAAAMSRSKREIPHYYLATRIDMAAALDHLEQLNAERPPQQRVLYVALLIRAVALAVAGVPEMNGQWTDAGFNPSPSVHVGIALSLREGGVVAPAIHDVEARSLDDVMIALRDLTARARSGSLRSSEMSAPTITVTNLGEQGVETVFPVIFPPQAAIVGFGRIVRQPWAVGDLVGIRPVLAASLAADHRVSDGHRGGRFLAAVDRLLQEPSKL